MSSCHFRLPRTGKFTVKDQFVICVADQDCEVDLSAVDVRHCVPDEEPEEDGTCFYAKYHDVFVIIARINNL